MSVVDCIFSDSLVCGGYLDEMQVSKKDLFSICAVSGHSVYDCDGSREIKSVV